MEDLDAASLEDVHAFFRRYYGPNNTVLTLVGDLTPEEGFAAAERYFGELPASAQPQRGNHDQLGPITEPVRFERRDQVPNDRLHMAFRLPVDNTEEFFAASLALDVIGGLTTSRLVQRLVRREQVANAVQAHSMGFVDGVSLGFIVLDIADGQDPDTVEARALEELERFAQEGPTDVEMESALAQAERSWLHALASQEERADAISQHTLLHDDPQFINTYLDRLTAVTAEQVQALAQTWLRPHNRAVVAHLVAMEEEAA
jgi:predicted Zn-dependent peptidase